MSDRETRLHSPRWAEHPQLLAFYSGHRDHPDDLYPSERYFLPWLARRARSVLDTGCAAGGFSVIWHHYQPSITYTGLDLSSSLIEAAKKRYPGGRFLCTNVVSGVDLPDRYATVVQALGWLNWEPAYARALRELWRLTDRYLFFDVRLVAEEGAAIIGRQRVAFTAPWDGTSTTPYVTVAWPSFAERLLQLQPVRVLGYGYWGKPAETVVGVEGPVCFATFVAEKPAEGSSVPSPLVCVDLPLPWPDDLHRDVQVASASDLATLVPQLEATATPQ